MKMGAGRPVPIRKRDSDVRYALHSAADEESFIQPDGALAIEDVEPVELEPQLAIDVVGVRFPPELGTTGAVMATMAVPRGTPQPTSSP